MIISHEHRYVFVEVPRTGSTAVSRELRANYAGVEILRKHATYRDFLRQATPAERSYFSFSSVRNPLDVAVSRYTKLKLNPGARFTDPAETAKRNSLAGRLDRRISAWLGRTDADFERFLLRWYVVPYDTWTSLDHRRMSMVMRFENLADDFAEAIRRIGLTPVRPLAVENPTLGRERDYVGYYSPRAIRRAVWVFGPYMEEWGYEFPESWGRVRAPTWSRQLMRVARGIRGLYWKHLRFADYVARRPGGMLAR